MQFTESFTLIIGDFIDTQHVEIFYGKILQLILKAFLFLLSFKKKIFKKSLKKISKSYFLF